MSIDKRDFLTDKSNIRMRKDTLHPLAELRHHLNHTFTGLIKRGTMNKGLRGDTANIKTGTSNLSNLENRHLQSPFGRILGSLITTRSCANNDQICLFHCTLNIRLLT